MKKVIVALAAIGAALLTVEVFYEHPTKGNGLKALLAVIQAGEAL